MQFTEWEPVYLEILADFAFDRSADEQARDILADLSSPFDTGRLSVFEDATVAIAGAGPPLSADLDSARSADAVIAASNAADILLAAGIAIDLLVTDLDKNPATARDLTVQGVPVAVHAHGDNVPALQEHVPTFVDEHVLPTTQAEPLGPVQNFGGFTDGDRGAFLADQFGASTLKFPGWDFDDPSVDAQKAHKLEWAERLLYWLEQRRDERFDLLDGRREAVEMSILQG